MASSNPARTWALATAGLLTQRNEHDHALLGGGMPSPETAAARLALLERDWHVSTRGALLEALTSLARAGDRKAFNEACTRDLENARADEGARRAIAFAHKHRARVGPKSLLAWDTGRLVTLAGWGYLAQLLSEDEAWSFILPMAQAAQRTYASWDELGKHTLLGREFTSGEWDPPLARAHLAMFDNPQSPWRVFPWGLDLHQHALTVPLQPIVIEAPPPPSAFAVGGATVQMPSAAGLSPALMSTTFERESETASLKPKRSALPFVIGGVALLAVGGVGAAFAFGFGSKKETPVAPSTSTLAGTSAGPSAGPSATPSTSAQTTPPIPSAAPQPSAIATPSHAPAPHAPLRPPPHPRGVPASPKKH